MHVLFLPNAFKGTLSAKEAALIMQRSWRRVRPRDSVKAFWVSDGGDGFLDAMEQKGHWVKIWVKTENALGEPLRAPILWEEKRKVVAIEMAQASGLAGVRKRHILRADSWGTGILIKKAIQQGAKKIVLGLGGSATCDGGIGAAQALGLKVVNKRGRRISRGGRGLLQAASVPKVEPIEGVQLIAIADVQNKPTGTRGGVRIFSPQKGASQKEVEDLERGMQRWLRLLQQKRGFSGQRAGFGAAGCILVGLSFLLEVQVKSGAAFFFDYLHLEQRLKWADIVFTAEGSFDETSAYGKFPYALALAARQKGRRCVLIAGNIQQTKSSPFTAAFSLLPGLRSWKAIQKNSPKYLQEIVQGLASVVD